MGGFLQHLIPFQLSYVVFKVRIEAQKPLILLLLMVPLFQMTEQRLTEKLFMQFDPKSTQLPHYHTIRQRSLDPTQFDSTNFKPNEHQFSALRYQNWFYSLSPTRFDSSRFTPKLQLKVIKVKWKNGDLHKISWAWNNDNRNHQGKPVGILVDKFPLVNSPAETLVSAQRSKNFARNLTILTLFEETTRFGLNNSHTVRIKLNKLVGNLHSKLCWSGWILLPNRTNCPSSRVDDKNLTSSPHATGKQSVLKANWFEMSYHNDRHHWHKHVHSFSLENAKQTLR